MSRMASWDAGLRTQKVSKSQYSSWPWTGYGLIFQPFRKRIVLFPLTQLTTVNLILILFGDRENGKMRKCAWGLVLEGMLCSCWLTLVHQNPSNWDQLVGRQVRIKEEQGRLFFRRTIPHFQGHMDTQSLHCQKGGPTAYQLEPGLINP